MKIIIKARNINLTEELKNWIEKKYSSLKKYINILKREEEIGKTLAKIFVEVEKLTRHHQKGKIFMVKTRICLPGRSLIVKTSDNNLLKSINRTKKELKEEIERYKFRILDKKIQLERKRGLV